MFIHICSTTNPVVVLGPALICWSHKIFRPFFFHAKDNHRIIEILAILAEWEGIVVDTTSHTVARRTVIALVTLVRGQQKKNHLKKIKWTK